MATQRVRTLGEIILEVTMGNCKEYTLTEEESCLAMQDIQKRVAPAIERIRNEQRAAWANIRRSRRTVA